MTTYAALSIAIGLGTLIIAILHCHILFHKKSKSTL